MYPKVTLLIFSSALLQAHADNGTWTNPATGGNWSNTANWSGSTIADGSGFNANFATLDLTADNIVHLDGARTLTSLTFGDTTTSSAGGWTLDNNGNAANILTLAGTTPNITVNALGTGKNATISAVVAGTAGLTKNGAGTLVLTGTNTYSGGTTVSEGTLQLGDGTTNGSINGPYNIASGATLRLARNAKTTVTNNTITGAGTVSLFVAGTANGTTNYQWDTFSTFDSNFTGKLVVEEGRVSYTLAQLGGMQAIEIQQGAQFLAWGTGTPSYTQAISIAGLGYGENGFPGGLRMAGNSGTATWSGGVTLTADSGIQVQRGSTFNITGGISGNFDCQFYAGDTTSSTGSVINVTPTAAVQNSYRSTTINGRDGGGAIVAGNQYAFSTGGMKVLNSSLRVNGNSFAFANLSGTGGTIGNYHATNAATLTIGSDGTSTSNASTIINGGAATLALTKVGNGTLTLTGNNSFTGGTNINAGAVQAGHASALGTGAITLGGGNLTTTVANLGTGALNLNSGALLLNGTAAGTATLGLNQDFTMAGGVWTVDLAAGLDQILGNGASADFLISGGTLNLGGGSINYGTTYQLLSGFTTGNVSGLTITGYDTANQTAFLSNTGVLSFVPEPSVALLGGLGALGLLRRRRNA